MSTESTIKRLRELHERLWLNATSHGTEQPYAEIAKSMGDILSELEAAKEEEKPVAWMQEGVPANDAFIFHSPTEPLNPFFPIPLYAHPAPKNESITNKEKP